LSTLAILNMSRTAIRSNLASQLASPSLVISEVARDFKTSPKSFWSIFSISFPALLPVERTTSQCKHLASPWWLRTTHLISVTSPLGTHPPPCRSGVCRSWRALGRRMFFSTPWDSPHLICHPNQLFCLSPRTPTGSRSGLLKCFVRREPTCSGPRSILAGRRYTLWLGKDPNQPQRARFLLCMLQRGRHNATVYLNSKCEGEPCAHVSSNLTNTKYTLNLANDISFLLESGNNRHASASDDESAPPSKAATAAGSSSLLSSASKRLAANTTAMPQVLCTLRYRARVRGLMQPRRMDITLPNPSQLASPTSLPKIHRTTSTASNAAKVTTPASTPDQVSSSGVPSSSPASGSSTTLGGASGCGVNHQGGVQKLAGVHRPSLAHVSAVAVLQNPATASSARFASTQRDDGNGTGASCSSMALSLRGVEADHSGGAPLQPTVPAVPNAHASGPAALEEEEGEVLAAEAPKVCFLRGVLSCLKGGSIGNHRTAPVDETSLPVLLRNKSPHWNDNMRCWCLNFRGRVKLASVKNFQLIRDDDPAERIVMQFGKVDKDAFILDFNPTVLSAAQAFAICLTTFDGKAVL
jgi:hypothetical protein